MCITQMKDNIEYLFEYRTLYSMGPAATVRESEPRSRGLLPSCPPDTSSRQEMPLLFTSLPHIGFYANIETEFYLFIHIF